MRPMRLPLLIILGLSSAAWADFVYTRDGKVLEGKAAKSGDKVLVQSGGQTITLQASEVERILEVDSSTTAPAPINSPASVSLSGGGVSAGDLCEPESLVFLAMRKLAQAKTGTDVAAAKEVVDRWQSVAHDRKRKNGDQWLPPSDYDRRRKAYGAALEEAREILKDLQKFDGETLEARQARQRVMLKASAKMLEASRAWPDPLLRKFLMGIAEYYGGACESAESLFQQCIKEAPRVAAFHQGRALALLQLNRGVDATNAAMQALKLHPESQELVALLDKAAKAVPGQYIKSAAFLEARSMLQQYESTEKKTTSGLYSRQAMGITWIMPGAARAWTVSEDCLPTPPYDRLIFRQAIGVPIAAGNLLVDQKAVENAAEIFVQVDPKTMVLAKAPRPGSSSGSSKTSNLPLTTLAVTGAKFTPLPPGTISAGDSVTFYAMNVNEEMGSLVRVSSPKVQTIGEGRAKLSVSLLPGETAAPVLSGGKLLGFFGGRTDVLAELAGPDVLFVGKELTDFVSHYARSGGGFSSYGYNSAKRTFQPVEASGKYFIVHSVFGETLK